MAENQSLGYLLVKVSTASGAIPVENVTIVIQGNDDDNQSIFISKLTNRDGLTEKIVLPAPNGDFSLNPSPTQRPYSTYNIDVYKEGYYPQHYNNVPIFEGITAVQNARIVPIAEFDAQNPYYTQSQNFDEYENPFL
jgi:hypothetical protein